jgi:hypothetical protein
MIGNTDKSGLRKDYPDDPDDTCTDIPDDGF